MRNIAISTVVAAVVILAGHRPHAEAAPLRIGIGPYADSSRILNQYNHLHRYLERLGYMVDLNTAPDHYNFLKRAHSGAYDVVLAPPHFLSLLTAESGFIPIVRLGAGVTPAIFVRADSPIKQVADLHGQTIAVPGTLTYVTLAIEDALSMMGLDINRDLSLQDAYTHPNVLLQVTSGAAEAGVTVPLMEALMRNRLAVPLRELTRVGPSMSLAYAAHERLGEEGIARLKEQLMVFPESPEGGDFANPVTGLSHKSVDPSLYPADSRLVKALKRKLGRLNAAN